jgi:hypothetical protein
MRTLAPLTGLTDVSKLATESAPYIGEVQQPTSGACHPKSLDHAMRLARAIDTLDDLVIRDHFEHHRDNPKPMPLTDLPPRGREARAGELLQGDRPGPPLLWLPGHPRRLQRPRTILVRMPRASPVSEPTVTVAA